MRLLISFTALFLSIVLLQLGAGGTAPLDAVSGLVLGFGKGEIGLLGSAHYLGFFIGCWWAPRVMGSVGAARAYAAFVAVGTIALAAHMLVVNPLAWTVMRVFIGFTIAGCYTIVEAWLQSAVTNATRGRAMGVYRVVDILGSLGAQLLIGVLPPAAYVSYNLLAILCCAALLPMALTRARQPEIPTAPRLHPGLAWKLSPLSVMAVITSGITTAGFRMVGPVYGVEVGLSTNQIALFLAAFVLGGALSQLPVGWLADKFDRRWVLIWLSVATVLSSAATVALSRGGSGAVMLGATFFGLTTVPIYSVAAAHANDYAAPDKRVELSAALLFIYALGATASPLIISSLIASLGPASMFGLIAGVHIALIGFGAWRMRVRPSRQPQTGYIYVPRTSFLIGRLLRRRHHDQ